jgi:hypothetical protein
MADPWMEPNRGQYEDGPDGTKLYEADLAAYKEKQLPSERQDAVRNGLDGKGPLARVMQNEGFLNIDGEDK